VKILSINVGRPRQLEWRGKTVTTSILKEPVSGAVSVSRLNLEGDEQSDLSVHGGPDKAVYVYPHEHYEYWREQLPRLDFPWGAFGENITSVGLDENTVRIGDRLTAGSAEFIVTQPRLPCYKLGVRFDRLDMVKRFQQSGRPGFYLAVLREGVISTGDAIEIQREDRYHVTVMDVVRLYMDDHVDPELLLRAIEVPSLPGSWREYFRERLQGAAT
jgi:MOSC domain-containing protein YiiM